MHLSLYTKLFPSKLDTLFYTVSFVSFYPDHNAQPELTDP